MSFFDKRAQLQIRIALNRETGNKNSINKQIAKIICQYSHSTCIKKAFMFVNQNSTKFLCVAHIHSPFWVTVLSMPGRIEFYQSQLTIGTNFGHLYWSPDWGKTGGYFKKKVFDPFSNPYLKCRNNKFFLKKNKYP